MGDARAHGLDHARGFVAHECGHGQRVQAAALVDIDEVQAHRVVAVQQRMQAVSMAFLQPVTMGHASYVLRGLQPTEDRVSLDGARQSLVDAVSAQPVIQTLWNTTVEAIEGEDMLKKVRIKGADGKTAEIAAWTQSGMKSGLRLLNPPGKRFVSTGASLKPLLRRSTEQ